MTTVVLADDHNLVREGLKHLLRDGHALKLVGEACDGLQALEMVEKLRPSVLLLDLMLPRLHGLEVIRRVRKTSATKIIVVSMYSDVPYVIEAFRNGAMGYVLKESTSAELGAPGKARNARGPGPNSPNGTAAAEPRCFRRCLSALACAWVSRPALTSACNWSR